MIDAHQNQNQNQNQAQQQQQQQQHQVPQSSPSVATFNNMPFMPTSPSTLSPNDAQRRLSETLTAPALTPLTTNLGQYGAGFPQQQNIYGQQQPYPQASVLNQQHTLHGYRSTTPIPLSPLAPSPTRHSPQPPSPLEFSLAVNTNFTSLNSSHQNLPILFDSNLTMSTQMQQDQQTPRRVSVATSTSPQMGIESDPTIIASPPLVIKTTNEDGNEVGFYYAIPSVTLNPAYSDADLFQDFTMMDQLGEDFVWIENLFDEPTPEEAAAMSVAAATGASPSTTSNGDLSSLMINTTLANSIVDVPMGSVFGQAVDINPQQQQQQQQWNNQSFSQTMQG